MGGVSFFEPALMEQWKLDFEKGKHFLSRHQAKRALHFFARSWRSCPPSECDSSSDILYYLGISLKRLGCYSGAVKLWITANRIKKRKRIKKMIERYANGYGMLRQANAELDDRNAFFSIQIGRYLQKKSGKKFSTLAEQDVVFELTNDYWKNLLIRSLLKGKTIEEKRRLFHQVVIPFPYVIMPRCIGDSVLNVNFNNSENNVTPSRCFCGSGLPFAMCCGRTPSVEELINDVF